MPFEASSSDFKSDESGKDGAFMEPSGRNRWHNRWQVGELRKPLK
jgi:hypothetical protein